MPKKTDSVQRSLPITPQRLGMAKQIKEAKEESDYLSKINMELKGAKDDDIVIVMNKLIEEKNFTQPQIADVMYKLAVKTIPLNQEFLGAATTLNLLAFKQTQQNIFFSRQAYLSMLNVRMHRLKKTKKDTDAQSVFSHCDTLLKTTKHFDEKEDFWALGWLLKEKVKDPIVLLSRPNPSLVKNLLQNLRSKDYKKEHKF